MEITINVSNEQFKDVLEKELAAFNEEHGTDCKDWKEAAIVEGGFTGESNDVSTEASIEAFDGEVLDNGKAVIYQVVELDKQM